MRLELGFEVGLGIFWGGVGLGGCIFGVGKDRMGKWCIGWLAFFMYEYLWIGGIWMGGNDGKTISHIHIHTHNVNAHTHISSVLKATKRSRRGEGGGRIEWLRTSEIDICIPYFTFSSPLLFCPFSFLFIFFLH